jgi:segregation and condensation protein B
MGRAAIPPEVGRWAAIDGLHLTLLSFAAMVDHNADADSPPSRQSPLSLSRLREAFAAMLNPQAVDDAPSNAIATTDDDAVAAADPAVGLDPCEISPQSVVEAMLFVGHPDGRPLSSRQMAAAMRGVSPREIDAAVAELNARYEQDAAPYEITATASGYQLKLRDEFSRMRDKLHGQVREAKLSPAAVEVLSVVAYNQPVTAAEIDRLRGAPSGSILATLVRRRLVRLERPADRQASPTYATTDRFLRLFGLEGVDALPHSEELEKV